MMKELTGRPLVYELERDPCFSVSYIAVKNGPMELLPSLYPLHPMNLIYTLGYAEWSIEELEQCLQRLEATLLDIRYVPRTTKPGFTRDELNERFGSQYKHLPAFGNVNYKEGDVKLSDPELGLQQLRCLKGPFILMCGCKRPENCHRSVVADFLANREQLSIRHLQSPRERAQPDLFGSTPSN